MKKRLAASIYLILPIMLIAQQQPYPHLRNVQVQARVEHEKGGQMFFYSYTVTNGKTSTGNIARIEIDISRGLNTLETDTIGLQFENDGYTEKNFRLDFPGLAERIVPVGYLRTPPGMWSGGNTNALTASYDGVREHAIVPGQTLSGFELMSKGLPGIRRCIVSPYFDVIALFPDPADTTTTYYVPPVDSVRQAVKFRGWTVGPAAPPASFNPIAWGDTIASFKHQSADLGWIINKGIVNSLDQKLENARKQLVQGNNNAAKNTLEAFVNEVEALNKKGKQLTSEAYALLKFNAEYLISKL
ncbi:MAG: hypothetical protein FJ215_13010 [Ignavibacteria bacterium]|nr:hypothetical protein [Ignavibacteria bacterium]